MKALRYLGPGLVRVEELAQPAIDSGEVLVAVAACGLCATDVKTFARGHPKIAPGSVLGHEVAGTVVGVADADGWSVGDRVVVAPYVACGRCHHCTAGHPSLCESLFEVQPDPGGFSEFVRVPRRIVQGGLLRLPGGTSFGSATFVEPLACSLHAFDMLRVQRGSSLLIIGDGPMGLLQAQLGRMAGASPLLVSGLTPERLAVAARFADVVIDAGHEDVGAVVAAHTDGRGADAVLVSVGETGVVESALSYVAKGGIVNLFAGLPGGTQLAVDATRIHYDEVALTGSFGFGPADFARALDLIVARDIDVDSLVTGVVPLANAPEALERAARGSGIKTVVAVGEEVPM